MKPVEIKVKDLMDLSNSTYNAGVRDGVRLAADVLKGCAAKVAAKSDSEIVEFSEMVAKVLHEMADEIHAKLEEKDRQP